MARGLSLPNEAGKRQSLVGRGSIAGDGACLCLRTQQCSSSLDNTRKEVVSSGKQVFLRFCKGIGTEHRVTAHVSTTPHEPTAQISLSAQDWITPLLLASYTFISTSSPRRNVFGCTNFHLGFCFEQTICRHCSYSPSTAQRGS